MNIYASIRVIVADLAMRLTILAVVPLLLVLVAPEEAVGQSSCDYCNPSEFGSYSCCSTSIHDELCTIPGCHHEGCEACEAFTGEQQEFAFRVLDDGTVHAPETVWHTVDARWLDILTTPSEDRRTFHYPATCGGQIKLILAQQ